MFNSDRFLFVIDKSVKNILFLSSGTLLVQAIVYFGLPIIINLYGTAEYGNYALVVSFILISSIISSAKYDIAILVPESMEDAISISKLSLLISVLFSVILFVSFSFIIVSGFSVPVKFSVFADFKVALFISIYLVLVTSNSVFFSLVSRLAEYKVLSYGRIIRFLFSICMSLVFGLLNKSFIFLILGDLIGLFFSSLYYYIMFSKKFDFSRRMEIGTLMAIAVRFKQFPLYSLPSSFLNKFIVQSPLFLMNHFFSPTHVGNYALCERLLSGPTALISESTATVFRGELSSSSSLKTKTEAFYKVLKTLIVLGIPIFLALFLFSGILIKLLFGDDFVLAERYTKFLVFPLFFQFVFTPLTFVLFYFEKQKLEFRIQFFSIFLLSVSLFVFSEYFSSDTAFLIIIVANAIIRILLEFFYSQSLVRKLSFIE